MSFWSFLYRWFFVVCLIFLSWLKPQSLYSQELTDLSLVRVLNDDIFVYLPRNVSQSFNVEWLGGFITIGDKNFAHGEGKLVFIRKSDGYRSIPFDINVEEGYITSNLVLKSGQFYKCLDEDCELKSLKLIFRYVQEERITEEVVTFEGEVSISGDVLVPKLGRLESKSFIYEGEFDRGKITGFGKFCFKSEGVTGCDEALIVQEGFWKKGKFLEGYLRTAYSDGALYEGWSVNGIPDGWGKVLWSDGSKYIGEFLEGKKHGKGFYLFPDGSWYRGEYKNDLKDGEGELYIKPLDVYYIGQFKAGKIQGWGELYIGSEFIYMGSFENNLPHGSGYLIDKSGNTYEIIVNNGNILFVNSVSQELSLYQLFSTEAWAFGIPSLQCVLNSFSKKIQEIADWVERNKTHLINAVKGCIAGGIGGAISGAAGGAVSGAAIGAVAGGNIVGGVVAGVVAGGAWGAVSGCLNQAAKTFEKSLSGENYTLKDAFQSLKEEAFSLENFAMGMAGGGGGALEVLGSVARVGRTFQKGNEILQLGEKILPGASKVDKAFNAFKVANKFRNFPPVALRLSRRMDDAVKKVHGLLCKNKAVRKLFCERDGLTLTLLSWNLWKFSYKSDRKGEIYNFLVQSKDVKKADIILLQEVMKAGDGKWNGFWKRLAKRSGRQLLVSEKNKNGETLVFLIKRKRFPYVRLVDKEVLPSKLFSLLRTKPSVICLQLKRLKSTKKIFNRKNINRNFCDIAIVNVHNNYKEIPPELLNKLRNRIKTKLSKKELEILLRSTKITLSLVPILLKLKKKFSPKAIIIGGDFNINPAKLEKFFILFKPVINNGTTIKCEKFDNFLVPKPNVFVIDRKVLYNLVCECLDANFSTLDHICTGRKTLSCEEIKKNRNLKEHYISDHFPIFAEFLVIY